MHAEQAPRTFDDPSLLRFERALDELRLELDRTMDTGDVAHLESIRTLSRRLELLGRGLLHFSFEPIGFSAGVLSLWIHKCLEDMEIAHASRETVASIDPLEEPTLGSMWGMPARALDWTALLASMRGEVAETVHVFRQHATGSRATSDMPEPRSGLHHRVHATATGYLARAVLTIPVFTRPFFWKVALGSLIAEVARDALAIAMTHAGRVELPDVSQAHGRARPRLVQVASARDIDLPLMLSLLCGGLDKRVEHHLFPHLSPRRLRQVAPRVKAVCAEFGVPHRSVGWAGALRVLLNRSQP